MGVLTIVIEEPQRGGLGPLDLSSHEKKRIECGQRREYEENQENSSFFNSLFIGLRCVGNNTTERPDKS